MGKTERGGGIRGGTVNDNHKNGLQHVCGNTRRDFSTKRVFAALWALFLIGRRPSEERSSVEGAGKCHPGLAKLFRAILKFLAGGRELFGLGLGLGLANS